MTSKTYSGLSNYHGIINAFNAAALRNEILAKGIPALSPPLGAGSVAILGEEYNFDMNVNSTEHRPNGWPRDANVLPFRNDWLHNDIKNVAYFYTHKVFIRLAAEIKGEQE